MFKINISGHNKIWGDAFVYRDKTAFSNPFLITL